MTLYQVAKMIPANFRQQLLESNAIYKAVVDANDSHMKMLVIYYDAYLNDGGAAMDMSNPCMLCLTNILQKFRILEPHLIQLEKELNLLHDTN